MTSADAKTEPDLFHEDTRGPLKLDGQSPDPRCACPCEEPVADAGQPIHELGEPRDRFELHLSRVIDPLDDGEITR